MTAHRAISYSKTTSNERHNEGDSTISNQLPEALSPTLARKYDPINHRIIHWICFEKYDGVRAIWTGHKLLTRNGNTINTPSWFTDQLPSIALDGELYSGINSFQPTVGIVRKKIPCTVDWMKIKYMVFDAPLHGGIFSNRRKFLYCNRERLESGGNVRLAPSIIILNKSNLNGFYHNVIDNGGEGLILRNPDTLYENKRSDNMLKMKPIQSSEAVVTGHKEGKGAKSGMIGAFLCQWGKVSFCVGSGLSDEQRKETPAIGSIVTFTYQGLTNSGKPRFPIFQAVRDYE